MHVLVSKDTCYPKRWIPFFILVFFSMYTCRFDLDLRFMTKYLIVRWLLFIWMFRTYLPKTPPSFYQESKFHVHHFIAHHDRHLTAIFFSSTFWDIQTSRSLFFGVFFIQTISVRLSVETCMTIKTFTE